MRDDGDDETEIIGGDDEGSKRYLSRSVMSIPLLSLGFGIRATESGQVKVGNEEPLY